MSNDNNRELSEEYKEIGINFRLYVTELTSTTRLMVPAMVIGMLILYGGVKQFAGVLIENTVTFHQSLWCGCVVIPFLKGYIALAVLRKYANEVILAIADFGYLPRISLNCCCICANV